MSEPKFTPGPWTAKDESGQYFCDHDWRADNDSAPMTCSAAIHANGEVVALVVTEGWSDAKIDANARLVATAPDLFEALDRLQNSVDQYFGPSRVGEAWPKFFDAEMRAARAALEKARGEPQ